MVLGSCSTFKVTALLGFIWLELLWQSSDQTEIENIKISTRPIIVDSFRKCLRSYHVESTASRPICEVKQRWADVSTRIGDGLGTRSVVDIFPSTDGFASEGDPIGCFPNSTLIGFWMFLCIPVVIIHSLRRAPAAVLQPLSSIRAFPEYDIYYEIRTRSASVHPKDQPPISFCSMSTTVLPQFFGDLVVLRFSLCPLPNHPMRNVPLNPGFYHLQILPVMTTIVESFSAWFVRTTLRKIRVKSYTPMTEMSVTHKTSCGPVFAETLLMIDQQFIFFNIKISWDHTVAERGESPPGQSALAVTMDYTTVDPRHSRIDGNAVGMLQISVYRQRFVRSCQSAGNEPKDAEQTEEELHPVEVTRAYRGSASPLLGVGYLRRRGGARYLRRRPKSPSASSKPPGFRSFHLRLVRGAGGQLAVPLRRLLLQGRRLTCHRRVSPDPEPGSPDAAIAIYPALRAHCSCPSPHLMSTGS
ncbi:hypothetical protein T07_9633 [Trichinella nelsoni]|uniref:Uncharacterized protein n=1 Tax=Trichinella nelsoni TaxID=6336 RepID=A0A0V0SL58_9BILA|nr:hypothetical protein T07_9633 [Trichinella nelsoni]